MTRQRGWRAAALGLACAAFAAGAYGLEPLRLVRLTPEGAVVRLAEGMDREGAFVFRGFPLADGSAVDLELERFRVASAHTRFVEGTDRGDVPMVFDPECVVLLRGRVSGFAGSHVFLSLEGGACAGRVELGPGCPSYVVASGPGVPGVAPGESMVLPVRAVESAGVGAACGATTRAAAPAPPGLPLDEPVRGMRQSELALDGDYPLYLLFGSTPATTSYMLRVYGEVSAIMMRDLKIRLDIVFLRVFSTPNNPYGFNGGMPQIPAGVQYDVAQMLSGTRDVGAGGGAFLCGAQSWVGFAIGYFTNPATSNVHNQDIIIAAHEMGHNLGAPHTHDIGIDQCDIATTPPRRGDIMSYCYYFSGGYANTDLRYHVGSQQQITNCLASRPNFVRDCNQNHVADPIDIATGVSADANGNGIPDECEDCNGNGVLDSTDIATGASQDENANGIPDECEPDCNRNGVPDDRDILLGTSTDLHGNGVPDECEADHNANGVSDYTEIMANMTLDIDRDGVLDAAQDCDADGLPDLTELDGANNVWAVASGDGVIREYHGVTGVLMRSSPVGHLNDAQDLIIKPDRRILVTSAADDRVVEFNHTGAYVRDLVAAGAGGLDGPGGMVLHPSGDLLVASRLGHAVLRFNARTGAPAGAFVAAGGGAGGLTLPWGLAFAPSGALAVTSGDNRVLEFDGDTGAFVRVLVPVAGNGGLSSPRGLAYIPGDRLLVASEQTDRVLTYNATTGAFLAPFAYGFFGVGLDGAWGIRLGPDGRVYVGAANRGADFHLTDPRMLMYDASTGWLIRSFIQRPDSKLDRPRGLDFMPGDGIDCNINFFPDACDIASGRSTDVNGNGVPDECEMCYPDCNADGQLGVSDFGCFQTRFVQGDVYADCNRDGLLGVADFGCFQTRFVVGCP